ncbi:MAG TPA: MFS transporter [Rhizomicrobium sp.]|nr:MFS transporter [Rhizomicrobium sp.]
MAIETVTPETLSNPADEQPSIPRALAYGVFQFPVGLLIPPLTLMLPGFYAETMGVPLAIVGTISAATRLLHIITDPLVGALSDRTRTRFGRRLPWIGTGALIAMIGVALAFMPVVQHASPYYLAGVLLLIYTATSFIQIPYYAWGAELPATAYGRARMLGWREVAGLSGLMLSSVAPLLASAFGFSANGRQAMAILACALLVALPLGFVILTRAGHERAPTDQDAARPAILPVLREFWTAIRTNMPYRRMLIGAQLVNIGLTAGQAVSYFFLSRILHLDKMFGPLLLIGGICAVLSAPLWLAIGRRVEFHKAVGWGCIIATLIHVVGFMVLPPGKPVLLLAIGIAEAVVMAGVIILAPTLQAFAIQYGTLKSGVDRAGTYVSLNQLAGQVANAVPFLLVFPLLAFAGFEPSHTQTSASGLFALRMLGIFAGAPFQIAGALVLLSFPITKADAARTSAELDRQNAHGI